MPDGANHTPSLIRHRVVAAATVASLLLYLDRNCLSFLAGAIQTDLSLDMEQTGDALGAFFWSYALMQVPAGWFSDRFGVRQALMIYIAGWSLMTAATGLAQGLTALMLFRLGCGLTQAGAYPACGALVSHWVPLSARGMANSVIALGGRLGGAIVPTLTALLLPWVDGWRGVMLLYGLAGLPVAWIFWFWVRSRPNEHPDCNDAERALITSHRMVEPQQLPPAAVGVPWRALVTNRSMWLMCIAQWGTNVGWAFLVTWLPTYLEQVYDVPTEERGVMSSVPLYVGMVGLLVGGWVTDLVTRRLGIRWGRALPLAASRFVAAAAFVACLWIDDPWLATAAFAVVAFMTDVGVGGTWGFSQDIGGRNVGSVLGWSNMWGNIGAALSPRLLVEVMHHSGAEHDWSWPFLLCAACFVIAGVASLGIRADRPLSA